MVRNLGSVFSRSLALPISTWGCSLVLIMELVTDLEPLGPLRSAHVV